MTLIGFQGNFFAAWDGVVLIKSSETISTTVVVQLHLNLLIAFPPKDMEPLCDTQFSAFLDT
jgi:hypothetical protein